MKTKPKEEAADESAIERWVVREVEENPAVREALARLAAAGMESSSYEKKVRAMRTPAVESFRLGGGSRLVAAEVEQLTHARAAVSDRLARTVDPRLCLGLRAQIESLGRDIADKRVVIEAAGPAAPDHAADLRSISAEMDEADVIIRKHKQAGLTPPPDLQARVVALRERFLEVEAAEKKRRAAFDAASAEASRLRAEAFHALGASVIGMARRRFAALAALLAVDIRRAELFPDEADPGIARDYAEFQTICALCEGLGRSKAFVEDVLWRELSERESAALRRVLRLGPVRRRLTRRLTVGETAAALGAA